MTSPTSKNVRLAVDRAVARVTLDRPHVRNAFDEETIRDLTQIFAALESRTDIRIVILTGEGSSFCAGADLNWMREMAGYDRDTNLEDARRLARMLAAIDQSGKAVIGRINGPTFGGACGLVACCDVAIASDQAVFAFSEVKIGLVPATIAPFVVKKIGASAARRLFVTGERFSAEEARRIGLVHDVVPLDELDRRVGAIADEILTSSPDAVQQAKELIREVGQRSFPAVNEYTARLIAEIRATPAAQKGMRAFLSKQRPPWTVDDGGG